MRRLSILAFAVIAVGCTSHSTPMQSGPKRAAPQILQKQPLTAGNWAITRIPYINKNYPVPIDLTSDSHGNIWSSDYGAQAISKITMNGHATSFPVSQTPFAIAVGSDGNVWVGAVKTGPAEIMRVSPTGRETDFAVSASSAPIEAITAGPDGAIWFAIHNSSGLGRITTTGQVTLFPSVPNSQGPIISGPDGNLWVAAYTVLYRIDTLGNFVASYTFADTIEGIATGSDGAVWVTTGYGPLGRVTMSGAVTKYPNPGSDVLIGIANGPDGKLWMFGRDDTIRDNVIAFDPTTSTFGPKIPSPYSLSGRPMLRGPDDNFWITGFEYNIVTYVNLVMTVSPASLTIQAPGQTADLTVSETNYTKTWSASTSNAAVATVASSGLTTFVVTATGAGTCTILVKDKKRNSVGVKVTVQ